MKQKFSSFTRNKRKPKLVRSKIKNFSDVDDRYGITLATLRKYQGGGETDENMRYSI